MPEIRQMPPHLADLIAAGEVVERPASVMKELLENAIDAKSSAIVAEIRHGGMTYIRVTDDGCGIAPQQLPTAFLRHATSKLRTESDLAAIGTLGFRGEALAAIASVSIVEILSRTAEADVGAALRLEGGVGAQVEDAPCPCGTTVVVRDLFYNTPARMKFMKKDSAEASAVSSVVQHIALSHPEISFKFIRDGEEVLHTPGDGQLKSAVYSVFGREFALGLIPVSGSDGEMKVTGFVTQSRYSRGSRAMETFFVNDRLVKSQLLTAALEEAYANQMMKGKFPGCVLRVEMPCDMVDVNVHPAKTVVKFIDERRVFACVHHVVADALRAPETPAAAVKKDDFYRTMTASEFRAAAQKTAPVKTSPAPSAHAAGTAPQPAFVTRIAPQKTELGAQCVASDVFRAPAVPKPVAPAAPEGKKDARPPVAAEEKKGADLIAADEAQQALFPAAPTAAHEKTVPEAPWRIVGEAFHTYIICECGDGTLRLIDKHAAHERINFDRLKANPAAIMSQPLLQSAAVQLSSEDYAALIDRLPLLHEFGFECEDFGENCILVRAVPSDISPEDAQSSLEDLACRLKDGRSADPSSARDALLHTMACKSAIRAGEHSDPSELRVLVERVQSGEVRYCPHGRPVCVTLTRYELEKMFKRA